MATKRARYGIPTIPAAAVAALAGLTLLASCATEEPAPPPSVELSVLSVAVSAVDLDSARVALEFSVANAGTSVVTLSSLRLSADSEGATLAAPPVLELGAARLEPGAATTVPFSFDVDAPAGDAPTVPLRLTARLEYASAAGGTDATTIELRCDFPRIMPPVMSISSIRILKDELINTKLRVDLVVDNPNAFPLSFAELEYRLYGEGRYWASGSLAKAFVAPAGQAATASLYLTMNFTDMSRSLLDQVIKLSTVRYRLVGAGRIDTGLEFLPQFVQPFDMAGETGVSR